MAAVVTSGRVLDVLLGPAGTGKSTATRDMRCLGGRLCARQRGRLAPSAAAADVLAETVGVPTENTAKWLTEQANQAERAHGSITTPPC